MAIDRRSVEQRDGTDRGAGKEPISSIGTTPTDGIRPGKRFTGAGTGTEKADRGSTPGQPGTEKRKRTPRQKSEGAQTKVEVESPQTLSGTPETPPFSDGPDAKKQRKPRESKKTPKVDGKLAARSLIEMVEVFTVTALGYDAAFAPSERFMIEDPLARLIERYAGAVGQYSGLVDPIMLLTGMGMYAIRLDNLARQRKAEQERAAAYRADQERQAAERAGFEAGPGYQNTATDIPPNGHGDPIASVGPDLFGHTGGVHRAR